MNKYITKFVNFLCLHTDAQMEEQYKRGQAEEHQNCAATIENLRTIHRGKEDSLNETIRQQADRIVGLERASIEDQEEAALALRKLDASTDQYDDLWAKFKKQVESAKGANTKLAKANTTIKSLRVDLDGARKLISEYECIIDRKNDEIMALQACINGVFKTLGANKSIKLDPTMSAKETFEEINKATKSVWNDAKSIMDRLDAHHAETDNRDRHIEMLQSGINEILSTLGIKRIEMKAYDPFELSHSLEDSLQAVKGLADAATRAFGEAVRASEQSKEQRSDGPHGVRAEQ